MVVLVVIDVLLELFGVGCLGEGNQKLVRKRDSLGNGEQLIFS